jgi:hypothetical protein
MLAPAKNSADNKILKRIKKVLVTLFKNGFAICITGIILLLQDKYKGELINPFLQLFLKCFSLLQLMNDSPSGLFYQEAHQHVAA